LQDGSYYQEFAFTGQAGQQIRILLESSDFDTYLILIDSAGNRIAENDDASSSTTDAEIIVTLPSTGDYTVIVNSYEGGQQGRFLLTLE
jgi:hypothetical protein